MDVGRIIAYILGFSLISMVGIIMAVVIMGMNQDYVLFNLYETSTDLRDLGMVNNDTISSIEGVANSHLSFTDWFDWGWVLMYVLFVSSSLVASYFARKETDIGFLTMLFYGVMLSLTVLSVFNVLTYWFQTEVLTGLISGIEGNLPMFSYWLSHIGFFSFIHLLLCLFVNKVKIENFIKPKNDLQNILESDELL